MRSSWLAARKNSAVRCAWLFGLGIGAGALGACAPAGDSVFKVVSLEGGSPSTSSSDASHGESAGWESSAPTLELYADSSPDVGPAFPMAEPSGGAPPGAMGDSEDDGSASSGPAQDASDDVPDTTAPTADASNDVDTLIADAGASREATPAPSCQQTCETGCCDATGTCVSGREDTACGTQAATCVDCASGGQVCTAHACVSRPVVDAAPTPPLEAGAQPPDSGAKDAAVAPTCVPSACANFCPSYFVACCRPDDRCGCALSFPRGQCF